MPEDEHTAWNTQLVRGPTQKNLGSRKATKGNVVADLDLEAGAAPENGAAKPKGGSLPFKPLSMTFSDLKYSVPIPKVRAAQSILNPATHSCTGAAWQPR
jgi:hypothetical protein